ncbi:MAG: DUF2157 domain-containing protein [Betaproteobacteria bacterium]|nr:DUF2157 domain-containing protein [Betaproteobacteria bacterium]MDH5221330.1 DUF2157 domain-containing protein [Betaproteobacteria bacterium]MDH5352134.1 DUF2157 domain-containing protein [Betaproteobacteria bacterium]
MSKHLDWLKRELVQWRAEGLVDEPLAQRILARYPAATERNWGRIIFSSIGAVLVGLGVILFFAYNWQALPKAAKLALVFGGLALAHGSALAVARRPDGARGLVEGLHVLGTMLFGAGIWLVAQIYHIDEHYPNAFLVWSAGALAMAWAMPSIVQALLALCLVTFWAGVELFDFHSAVHGAPLLVVLGVLPLAWWRRSPVLLFFTLAVLFVVTAFAAGALQAKAVMPLLYLMGAASLIAGAAAPATPFPDAGGPLRFLGLTVVLGCSYLLSFKDLAGMLRKVDFSSPGLALYFGAAGLALAGALALLARGRLAQVDAYRRWQLVLLAVALAIVLIATFRFDRGAGLPTAVAFNLIALGFAALLILEGSAQRRARLVAVGCLLFAMIAIGRYADLFTSLLVRSAVFVAVGVTLFLVGNFYARSRRRAQEAQP